MPKVKTTKTFKIQSYFMTLTKREPRRKDDFDEKGTKTFLTADIPLYKLVNIHIKNLFSLFQYAI